MIKTGCCGYIDKNPLVSPLVFFHETVIHTFKKNLPSPIVGQRKLEEIANRIGLAVASPFVYLTLAFVALVGLIAHPFWVKRYVRIETEKRELFLKELESQKNQKILEENLRKEEEQRIEIEKKERERELQRIETEKRKREEELRRVEQIEKEKEREREIIIQQEQLRQLEEEKKETERKSKLEKAEVLRSKLKQEAEWCLGYSTLIGRVGPHEKINKITIKELKGTGKRKLMKSLGNGGTKRAYKLDDGRAILFVRCRYKVEHWKTLVECEVNSSRVLTKLGLLNSQLVSS